MPTTTIRKPKDGERVHLYCECRMYFSGEYTAHDAQGGPGIYVDPRVYQVHSEHLYRLVSHGEDT